MATWHKAADPLLNSDIPALAQTVSCHTHTCVPGEDMGAAMTAAVAAALAEPGAAGAGAGRGAGSSRVATLIVPHDLSLQPAAGADTSAGSTACGAPSAVSPVVAGGLAPGAQQFVREAAAALQACPRGKAALYLGGRAGLAQGV